MKKLVLLSCVFYFMITSIYAQHNNNEPYRPVFHFTPKSGWMNDPNGMVYYNGIYHLFFQYNPDSTVWGPMHWGHAVSKDLVHWKELPIALYPDSLGTIFSGSAVIDVNNTAGFGSDAMVAIFTQHNPELEKNGSDKFQNQSIAFSLNGGKSWTKYKGNPVIKNPGIRDFRDPKVSWYAPAKKWIMTLATLDHITFYASTDLKHWQKESTFGKGSGAHGGVWECPDLFPLTYKGRQVWVLIVNVNPGGPNGGSATQYFTGTFDGHQFKADDLQTKWLDYGPDEYAGVTWSNTGETKLFIGWMSNWEYAQVVPTKSWRSATTTPRELSLERIDNQYLIASKPVKAIDDLKGQTKILTNLVVNGSLDLTQSAKMDKGIFQLDLKAIKPADFAIELSNDQGDMVAIGYDKSRNVYYIDRTQSGLTAFSKNFAGKHTAPRFAKNDIINLKLLVDKASVELFADDGLTTMTSIIFPHAPLNKIKINTTQKNLAIKKVKLKRLE
ncbi:glycoside hydrolase family 32 protein [Arachidicoccus ginsenosidivorans]|uniref:Glycoside hydrolase family 32 protein n=1 Tax=Arachidicoccus ginsenosidivorans TaxID=496057 RepID=A0A5B8VQ35_9BACT|nr:glycoside hydrolase family 32 protein [Arachidicoccus ginsenosidivorans]QEC72705.1 glycoside hydrolase family 32 protein [Arachidicoccus ginsenosidivorans]